MGIFQLRCYIINLAIAAECHEIKAFIEISVQECVLLRVKKINQSSYAPFLNHSVRIFFLYFILLLLDTHFQFVPVEYQLEHDQTFLKHCDSQYILCADGKSFISRSSHPTRAPNTETTPSNRWSYCHFPLSQSFVQFQMAYGWNNGAACRCTHDAPCVFYWDDSRTDGIRNMAPKRYPFCECTMLYTFRIRTNAFQIDYRTIYIQTQKLLIFESILMCSVDMRVCSVYRNHRKWAYGEGRHRMHMYEGWFTLQQGARSYFGHYPRWPCRTDAFSWACIVH